MRTELFLLLGAALLGAVSAWTALPRSQLTSLPTVIRPRGAIMCRASGGGGDEEEAYGPVGSLLRQGPVPFLLRIRDPDTYNAAVTKFMLRERCDRNTAQANMDAYFQDPNGWLSQRARDDETGQYTDYRNVNMSPKSLLLTGTWTLLLLVLISRAAYVAVERSNGASVFDGI